MALKVESSSQTSLSEVWVILKKKKKKVSVSYIPLNVYGVRKVIVLLCKLFLIIIFFNKRRHATKMFTMLLRLIDDLDNILKNYVNRRWLCFCEYLPKKCIIISFEKFNIHRIIFWKILLSMRFLLFCVV